MEGEIPEEELLKLNEEIEEEFIRKQQFTGSTNCRDNFLHDSRFI